MFNWRKTKKPPASAAPTPHSTASSAPRPKQSLLSLEQRLMFDAAAAATASEVAAEQVAQDQAESAMSAEGGGEPTAAEQDSQDLLHAITSYSPGESTTEVVFVDPTVPDYQSLIAGMGPNVEVVMLDATRDGVEQIAESLAGRSGIDAVHLISHGNSGELQLGAGTLNTESMLGKYANELSTIQQSLSEQADILIYGCDFAEGERGQTAVTRLAELTGADVQASTDATGHISLGGDWEFEVQTGTIETQIVISEVVQVDWVGLLATETVKDTFSSDSYSNNNGTQSWSTSWSETDASGGGASGGDVRVNSSQLRIDTDTVGNAISRGVNLSGATSATLTFDYTNTLLGADRIEVRVSTDGGANYSTLGGGIFSSAANTGSGAASLDLSGYMSANTRIQFIVTGTGGGERLYVDNVQISYETGVANSAPTITNLSGDSLSYSEGDGAVVIEQSGNALVADVDSTNLDTGTLTVSIPAGGDSAEDVLSIRNQGTGAGQIGVSGANVTYQGVTIGTFTGGSGGSNLAITLNSNATPTAATALVKNITYENTDTNAPTTGARTVRYVLTDGDGGTSGNCDTTVTVSAANDAPVNTVPGAQTVNEDTALSLSGISVTDVDGNLSTVQLAVGNGTLTVTLSGGATISSGSNGTNTLTLSGSQADINATLASLTYQGATDFAGADTLTVTSTDSNSGTDVDTVAITVTGVNDAPIRTAGTVSNLTLSEDAGLASLGLGGVSYSPAGGADESGQTLTYAVTALPSGTLGNVYLADGTTLVTLSAYTLAEIQGMQFQPTANASGVTAFQFNVYDSGGTANGGANTISQFILITVTAVNDAPTITNLSGDSVSYTEGDGAIVIEQGGNALVADVDSTNLDTGTLTVSIPAGGDSAEDVLSIRNQGTGAGQIGVSGSNVTYQGVTIGTFTGGSSGNSLVITLNSSATPTAVTALVQNITYENTDTAAPTTGARTVRYALTDGDGGTSANYDTTVTVSGVNDAPTDLSLSGNSVAENAANGTVIGTVTGTDPDSGDTKTYSLTDSAGGRFAINISTGVLTLANGSLLNYESATSHSVTVRVTDSGGLTYDEAFTINLTNVAEAPIANDDSASGNEDSAITGNVLANDTDGDGGPLTASLVSGPSHGSLTLNADGSFSYTPDPNWNGTDSFQYLVNDGSGLAHYWGLEGNGTDIVGGANGTLMNDPTTIAGQDGTALQFDGVNDYVALPDLTYNNEFSLVFHFKVADNAGSGLQYFYSHGTLPTAGLPNLVQVGLVEDAYAIPVQQNNIVTTVWDSNDAAGQIFVDIASLIGDGQWHQYALTVTSGSGTQVYVDGVLRGSLATGGDAINPAGNAYIGARSDLDATRFLNTGSCMDSVALFNRALTSSEVTNLVTNPMQATVTLTVNPVNDAPTGADATVILSEDTAHTFTTANFGFSDIDAGDTMSAVCIDTIPTAGTLTLSGVAVTAGQVVSVADITAGNLVFTPAADATGTGYTSVTFSVRDSSSTYDTAPNTLTFDVTAVNDAPIRTAGTVSNLTVSEDAGLVSLGLGSVTYNPAGGGDESGQTLTYAVTALPSGTLGNVYLADGTTLVTLSSYTLAEIQGMQFQPTANASGVTAFQFNVYDSGGTANGGANTISQFTLITVTAVNDAPTITNLSGDSVSYTEGDGAIVIEQGGNALVADVDSTNFDTGSLAVSIPSGGDSAEDVLSIRNQGTGAGQIGVSGSNVTYQGVTIGTFTGGSSGNSLVITLNSSATPTAVTALVQNITYENTDTSTPTTGARTVRYVLTDGDGGASVNYDTTVTVTATNDAPVLTPVAPDVTFVEGGLAQLIDAIGTIVDVDSANFDGGVLSVSISVNGTADDRVLVGNWGTGPGQVGVSGSTVTYGGTVIGTVSGGTSGSDPLLITFNANATAATAQEVYRSIQFNNVSDSPSTATRTLTIGLTDGDGGTATPQNKLVYVQGTNDVPVITFGEVDKNFTEGALAVMIDALPNISDLDSTNFDTGTLTITISANPSVDDRVELLNTGMGAGQIGVSGTNVYYGGTLIGTQVGGIGAAPFVVTFNTNADATIVSAVMANIRFWVAGDAPSTATRTVEAVLTDGDGGTSLTASKQITVTAVNDAPVVTGGTSGSGTEDTTLTGTLTATDNDGLSDGSVFTVTGAATQGTASIDPATGLWSYTPTADWIGTDSFTVTITDDAGNSSTQVISVTVTPVVDLTNDSLTTNEDTAISANVLTGTNGATADTFEGTPVLTSVTQGANGTVTFLANGTVTYTPTANFNGPDSFTYTITSGGVTETATVNVTVTAVNDAPTITNLSGDSLAYSEGDGAVVIEQSGNALVADVDSTNFDTGTLTVSFAAGSDSAEDVLSIQNQGTGAGQIGISGSNVTYQGVTIGTFTGGSGGTNLVVTLNASATPTAVMALVKNITYQDTDTNAPTTGARTVRYALTDGDGGASANYDTTVTVSGVNDAPVNTVPGPQSVAEDTALNISGLSVTDVDGNLSTVQLAVSNGTLTVTLSGAASISSGANGSTTLTLSGGQADLNSTLASLNYQGSVNYNGTDTLTVTSTDSNSVTDVDTVAITVGATNDVPLFVSGGGMVTASFGFGDDYAYNTLLQSDGKIVLAGFASNGKDTDFALVRLNADGTLDTKFGSEGKVLTPIGLSDDQGGFGAVLQSDGKIVVVGHSDNGTDSDAVVLRYHTDGSLDSSFGIDGIVTTDVGSHGELAYGVVLQSDGKIVLVGGSNDGKQQDLLVARYNTDGSLDAKFGSGGIVTSDFGGGFSEGIGVVIQSDGSIVVSGISQTATDFDFALVRYSADGTLDSGFGKGGILTTDFSGGMDVGTRLVMQPEDGKFVVIGYFSNGADIDYGMVRYNADGTLDGSFGTGGIVTLHQGDGEGQSLGIALLSDGKILVAGNVSIGNTSELILARYQSDGTLDEKFGIGGIAQQSVGGFNDRGTSLVVQDDGRIVVGGVSLNGVDGDFAAVRFNSDGTLDTSFGTPTYVENGTPVVLDSDIRIMDIELALVDDFAGSTLTLVRNGGASSQDAFSSTGALSTLAQDDKLVVDGITIGTVTTNSKGTLLLTFNKSATQALVNSAMQKIAYSNSSDDPPASVQVDWMFNDGNTGSQGTGEALTATGRTTVNITAVNDAPSDLALSGNSVTENAATGTVVGTVTGTDPDSGDTKTHSFTDSAGGRFAINSSTGQITVANGSLLNYESATSHSVTVRVTDSGGLIYDEAFTINLTNVNEAPTDLNLSANTAAENAANGTVVGTVSGTDPDSGDTKVYSFTDSAGGRFAINSSTGQITVADGSLLNYEAATSHSVTVRVTDAGGLTNDETFTINLTNVNEAPTGADATITMTEDTAHTLTAANFGFSDVDAGDSVSAVRIDTLPSAGTLTLSGVAVTAGQVVSVADLTAGNLVFTPAANATGSGYASLTFSVRDASSTYDAATNTLTVDVTAVNDAPISTAGTVSNLTLSEDAGLASLGLGGVTYSPGGGPDESGQTLTYAVTAIPSASVGDVFLADGTTRVTVGSYTLADIQGMQFKPAANASGVTAFQFNVYDSGGTANGGANTISQFILITVTAVNDAPTITNLSGDSLNYSEGAGAVVIEQTGNALVADVDSTNLDTGTLTVSIPAGGDSAEDVLSIRNQGTGVGQIGVSGSNITYEGVTIGTYSGGSGGTNLVITLNSSATPTAVTALVQNITYENTDTNAPTTGARTVRYALTDGDGGTSANYDTTVTVSGQNDAPVNSVPGAQSVTEDTALNITGVSVNDVDGNLSSVQLGVLNGTVSVILQGGATISAGSNGSETLTLSGSQADINGTLATLVYQGTLNFNGSDMLTVTSTDANSGSDVDTVALTVTAVDDPTVVTGGTSGMGNEDTTGTGTGTLTATDAEGLSDGSVFSVSTAATQGTASIDPATGLWSYSPNPDYHGADSFTVTITDDAGQTTTQVISVTVTAVNDAPVLSVNISSTVAEGGTDTIDSSELAVTDVDNTAAQLTYTIGTGPAYGRLELTTAPGVSATTFTQADIAANQLVYVHDGSETTSDNFTFTVNDGAGGSIGSMTVTLTITPVNDTPTITSDGGASTAVINVAENVSAVTIVTGADVDLPAQALTYSLSGGVDQARFTINIATGALNFTAPPDFEVVTDANGDNVYVVQVQVVDSQGASTTQTIQVTVMDAVEGLPPTPTTPLIPPVLLPTTPPPAPGPPPSNPASAEPESLAVPAPSSMTRTGEPGISSVPPASHPDEAPPGAGFTPDELRRTNLPVKDHTLPQWNDDQPSSPFTIIPVEASEHLESEEPNLPNVVSDILIAKLDAMATSLEEAIGVDQEQHVLVVRVATLTGVTLSVGFVAWALQSSTLLASCLATLPAWKNFDPLPVVNLSRRERNRRQTVTDASQQHEQAEFDGLQDLFDIGPSLKPKA